MASDPSDKRRAAGGSSSMALPAPFTPVPVRPRHDGWTAERQMAFIEVLAETGIVEEACRRVGMSRTSADNLRHRPEGVHFRRAWEAAIDYSLYRIEEEVHARARRGVARPIFYKGEQIGERLYFDERLTMFLLRYRDPHRYGRWRDQTGIHIPEDGTAQYMWHQIDRAERDASDDIRGIARKMPAPVTSIQLVSEGEHDSGK